MTILLRSTSIFGNSISLSKRCLNIPWFEQTNIYNKLLIISYKKIKHFKTTLITNYDNLYNKYTKGKNRQKKSFKTKIIQNTKHSCPHSTHKLGINIEAI